MFSGAIIAAGGHTAGTEAARIWRQKAGRSAAPGSLSPTRPACPFRLKAPLAWPQRAIIYGRDAAGKLATSFEPAIQQAHRPICRLQFRSRIAPAGTRPACMRDAAGTGPVPFSTAAVLAGYQAPAFRRTAAATRAARMRCSSLGISGKARMANR